MFLRTYAPDGSVAWTQSWGTRETNLHIGLDGAGHIIVAGESELGPGESQLWVHAYDTEGALVWSDVHDAQGLDSPRLLTTDREGNVVVAGMSEVDGADQFWVGVWAR